MRLFELLLLLSNVGLYAASIWGRRKYKLLLAASGTGTLLLIVHLLIESLRIQLLFPYGYTLIMLVISIYSYVKLTSEKQIPSRSVHKRWMASGCSLIAYLLTATGTLL